MDNIAQKIRSGEIVPFIGMGVFANTKADDGSMLPFDSDSMVLALNNGRAMSPRLMYEYSRAAMSLEQRKGRDFIVQMTNHVFTSKSYELPKVYEVLKSLQAPYVIDTNLDDSLQKAYADTEHFLITGVSRIMADYARYVIYKYNPQTSEYTKVQESVLHTDIPILFKPMGSTRPEMNFIISDADFVDWLTEAMGGYAMPKLLKEYRKEKEYLFLGMDFSRDTFRMVANEITLGLKGGQVISNKTEFSKKEQKFFDNHQLQHIRADLDSILEVSCV